MADAISGLGLILILTLVLLVGWNAHQDTRMDELDAQVEDIHSVLCLRGVGCLNP